MRGVQAIIRINLRRILSAVTTITTALEIILHIVDIIEINHEIIALRSVETARTFVVVNQQVMMVRSRRSAPLTSVSACAFRVSGVIQTLMHNIVLHSNKMAVVGIHILLR